MMKIKLKNSTYTGVAGSSLSETRCEQTVDLYNFILSHPGLSYREVRSESVKEGLYKSESVLRTFCPLLRELGFITTDQSTPMSFTKDGELFVRILISLENAKNLEDETQRDELIAVLESAKCHVIQLGILNMNQSEDDICKKHNIWLVLSLLDKLDFFDWNDFWLALKMFVEDGSSLIDFKTEITMNRANGITYEPINADNNQALFDTTFSYIRALLKEANLIEDYNSGSKLTTEGKEFIKNLRLWNL